MFAVLSMSYMFIWANIAIICFKPVQDIVRNRALDVIHVKLIASRKFIHRYLIIVFSFEPRPSRL